MGYIGLPVSAGALINTATSLGGNVAGTNNITQSGMSAAITLLTQAISGQGAGGSWSPQLGQDVLATNILNNWGKVSNGTGFVDISGIMNNTNLLDTVTQQDEPLFKMYGGTQESVEGVSVGTTFTIGS